MSRWAELADEVMRTGYYPELLNDSLATAIAGESVDAFVLSHETTFEGDELRRHMTVAVLTPSRLVVSHTDELPPEPGRQFASATTSTEAVRISSLGSVVIQRLVSEPAHYGESGSEVQEVVVTIGWGAVSRLDLAPAGCEDPNCQADHGFTGSAVNDDLTIRVARAADGEQRLRQAWEFAAALSRATAR